MRSMAKAALILLILAGVGYIALCAVLYLQQDSLIFFPARDTASRLESLAKERGFESWRNTKGDVIGWQSTGGDRRNVTLVVHGNGGHAIQRAVYQQLCRTPAGDRKMYLLEYPGYGSRPGKPSESAFVAATLEAIDILASQPGCRIWLMGQSLGTGVACAAVAKEPAKVAALVLLTPFDALASPAREHYPWMPVSLLLSTRFDSVKNLRAYAGPVAFVLAANDSVIPAKFGLRLFESYAGQKQLWQIPGAEHNDMEQLFEKWPEIANWLEDSTTR